MVHFELSTTGIPFAILMHCSGQFFTQISHLMQPCLQFFATIALFTFRLEHCGREPLASLGITQMMCCGHSFEQALQPVQRSLSIRGIPSSPIVIAPNLQTLVQWSKPWQPQVQRLMLPVEIFAALQLFTPMYSPFKSAVSRVPRQAITATIGFTSALPPAKAEIFSATLWPPTVQLFIPASPFTIEAA
jgi:hypothetical protein